VPRVIIDPISGANVTATVTADLQAGRTFVFANLYRIFFLDWVNYNPYQSYASLCWTDCDEPVYVNQYQIGWNSGAIPNVYQLTTYTNGVANDDGLVFSPEVVPRNPLIFEVGFKANSLVVNWMADDSKEYGFWIAGNGYNSGGSYNQFSAAVWPDDLTLKQAFLLGAFDRNPFFLHRAIFADDFPTRGGSFVGTTLMFRGYVAGARATAESLELTVDSLMQVFLDTQVPAQTIQPNGRGALFIPNQAAPFGGDFGNATPTGALSLTCSTSESVTANALADCWISFCPRNGFFGGNGYFSSYSPGIPLAPAWRIRGNTAASGGSVTIYTYEPYIEGNGTFVNVLGQGALNEAPPGFPYVPRPETDFPQVNSYIQNLSGNSSGGGSI
jgi:hypothetical protein